MTSIITLFVLICCLLMFVFDRPKKVALLYFAMMCMTCFTAQGVPYGTALNLLPVFYLISEIKNISKEIKLMKKTVVYPLMLLSLLANFIVLVNSPHYNSDLKSSFIFLLLQLVPLSFCLVYGFHSIKSDAELKPLLKSAFLGMILLTLFGIINLLLKSSPILNLLFEGQKVNSTMELLGSKYSDSERFRVQSLFFNPFDYGYICMVTLIMYIYAYSKKLVSVRSFGIIIICCLFGIVVCGCRTIMVCTLFGGLAYVIIKYKVRKSVKYILTAIIVFGIISQITPIAQNIMNQVLSVFSQDTTMESSSSLDMRQTQYLAVLYYIQNHFWLGRGAGFFLIDLGWADGLNGLRDKDLMGLEGAVLSILLERGFIGVLFYIAFYVTLLISFLKKRKVDKDLGTTGAVLIIIFLIFGNMTGELLSVAPTLLLSGILLRLLYNKINANGKCFDNCGNSCIQS